jgi:hypothetical protein
LARVKKFYHSIKQLVTEVLHMTIRNTKNWVIALGMAATAFLSLGQPLTAGITSEAKQHLKDYFKECPWLGLVSNEITYGPIKIYDVNIHNEDKYAIVAPEEILKGTLKYKLKSKDLDSFHLYHLVVGIKEQGAQDCITHSLGFWDSKGKGSFTLTAPKKPGIYEVRFLLTEGATCDDAREAWNKGSEEPSSAATIGIIVVE